MDKIETNKIYEGHAINVLQTFPDESINMVICSPPYYALRDYGLEGIVWDGDKNCEHDFSVSVAPRRNRSVEDIKNPETVSLIQSGNKGSQHDLPYTSFCIKCNAWKGQLGLEPTFDLYIKHLCDIFDEVKRVLTKDGTCWVNLGDTYQAAPVSGKQGGFSGKAAKNNPDYSNAVLVKKPKSRLKNKTLLQIPNRFAIEMCDRGWILRNDLIWHKPNCFPSSVKDRFTVDYEHIFFFVKNEKYYFEQQFEPYASSTINDGRFEKAKEGNYTGGTNIKEGYERSGAQNPVEVRNSVFNKGLGQGRNMRSVWTITTKGFRGAHFATFNEALIETPIKAGCPEFICKKCGKPKEKIYENLRDRKEELAVAKKLDEEGGGKYKGDDFTVSTGYAHRDLSPDGKTRGMYNLTKESGYSDCGCDAGFRSGVVLDPFIGSGTTAVMAKKLGRDWVGIELNSSYINIATKRINNDKI